jgi:DNA-directed RNA polymerase specialized sigma subunit
MFHRHLEVCDEVNQLEGRARVALGLILIYGLNVDEVAFILGVSPLKVSIFIEACLKIKKFNGTGMRLKLRMHLESSRRK